VPELLCPDELSSELTTEVSVEVGVDASIVEVSVSGRGPGISGTP